MPAGLDQTVGDIFEAHGAGRPTDETACWTNLKPLQLTQELLGRSDEIGCNAAAHLLGRAGFRRRSLRKEASWAP